MKTLEQISFKSFYFSVSCFLCNQKLNKYVNKLNLIDRWLVKSEWFVCEFGTGCQQFCKCEIAEKTHYRKTIYIKHLKPYRFQLDQCKLCKFVIYFKELNVLLN